MGQLTEMLRKRWNVNTLNEFLITNHTIVVIMTLMSFHLRIKRRELGGGEGLVVADGRVVGLGDVDVLATHFVDVGCEEEVN